MKVHHPPTARRRSHRAIAVGVALALLVAACGSADDTDDTPPDAAEPADEPDAPADEPADDEAADDDAGDPAGAEFEEIEFVFGTYIPQAVSFGVALEAMFEEVTDATGGAVTFDAHYDGSLYNATELRDAVLDGRLDMAHISAAYFPNEFPLTTASHIPFISDNMPAQMAAFNELYEQDEQYRAEFENQGLKLLTFMGVPAGIVTAPDPVESIDYFQSTSNRAAADFVTALQAIDANEIVTLPTNELYEALQRGVADTVVGFTLDVGAALSLQELTPYFVDVGAGLWADTMLIMREDTWNSFSPALQEVLGAAVARVPQTLADVTSEREDAACTQLLETGGTPMALPDAEVARWADAASGPLLENWSSRAAGAGVADPDGFYATYLATMERMEAQFEYSSGIARCIEQAAG